MKTVKITCDTCKRDIGEDHIKLGSETETDLCFENKLKTKVGETQYISRYRDLHFCSKICFVGYFFES